MKKILALVLSLCMVFALCASASADNSDVKVGLITIHDENSTYDKNFIDGFNAACEATGVTGVIKTNVPEDQAAYDASADLADSGCAIVFTDSYGHQQYALQAAQEFPEVQFVPCTGDMAADAGLDNYHNAFADIYAGRFLAGVAAGMKFNELIESGKITAEQAKMGYVGAMPYAEVVSGYTATYLGAKYICPSVTMDVIYTASWYDETLEKEAAQSLIDGGAVIISQHADSMGAPNACEAAGVFNVTYNGSTQAACPNTYLISSNINWTVFFTYAINAVLAGENFDTDWTSGFETGAIELKEIGAAAAPGTAEKIEELKAALIDGSLHVFDCNTWTVNGEKLDSYTGNPFYPVECIWDGYFHESETRSAPYFDIIIDGITVK